MFIFVILFTGYLFHFYQFCHLVVHSSFIHFPSLPSCCAANFIPRLALLRSFLASATVPSSKLRAGLRTVLVMVSHSEFDEL